MLRLVHRLTGCIQVFLAPECIRLRDSLPQSTVLPGKGVTTTELILFRIEVALTLHGIELCCATQPRCESLSHLHLCSRWN